MISAIKITTAQFLEDAVDLLGKAVDKVRASGRTKDSINSVLTETEEEIKATIFAREFFSLLESGRRPTDKNPSPEMIENLTDYARARGMDNPKKAAWALAKTLNKKGDKTFRAGGRDLYSQELDKLVTDYTDHVSKDLSDFVVDELRSAFKKK